MPSMRFAKAIAMLMLAAVAASGCASIERADEVRKPYSIYSMYKALAGDQRIECQGFETPDLCGVLPVWEFEGQFFDCSESGYVCVVDYADVLAIPKSEIRAGMEYEFFGASFKVESCFADNCATALISSRCSTALICECRYGSNEPRPFYFYWDKNKGVTAFYLKPEGLEIPPEYFFALIADQGFLKASLDLPQRKRDRQCF